MTMLEPTVADTQVETPYVPDEEIPYPDTSLLVTDDGEPVDNLFTEKQQRLLVDPLYVSWTPPDGKPFRAMANVGLFNAYKEPPHVPDAMLALDVPPTNGILEADNRSYFIWVIGKPPDVVIEVVSDTRGGEDTRKMKHYAAIGVRHYAIFDPSLKLNSGILRVFSLHAGKYLPADATWLEGIGLGLTLWDGDYEGERAIWLRWVDDTGTVVSTGKERVELEAANASHERRRAEAAEARIRELEAKLAGS